ncbi:MAG: tyrosine-protein phosphatase [Bdellovibrio sp.]|nr:tyrosine-protein phosphatase [Bdellovibrio sp.]
MKLKAIVGALSVLLLTQISLGQEAVFESHSNNFTDISLLQIPEFHQVNKNIYRGGYPQNGDLADLSKQGIKTIIDIDNDSTFAQDEQRIAESFGMKYIFSPMSAFSAPGNQQVDSLLKNLQDATLFPIFIHCKHGQDRTGVIVGLYRFQVDGWTSRVAYDEMLKFGFHPILKSLDSYYKKRTAY